MALRRVVSVVSLSACWLLLSVAADLAPASSSSSSIEAPKPAPTNSSRANNTLSGNKNRVYKSLGVDSSTIQRTLYVVIGITIIAVLYFLIRAVRLKKPEQRKKYGLLSNYDDSVEMDAVESEEDDTLYEARSLRR